MKKTIIILASVTALVFTLGLLTLTYQDHSNEAKANAIISLYEKEHGVSVNNDKEYSKFLLWASLASNKQ